jgi:hypothetical protein
LERAVAADSSPETQVRLSWTCSLRPPVASGDGPVWRVVPV